MPTNELGGWLFFGVAMVSNPDIIPCGKGHSFFEFISSFWKASYSGNDRAFHRLCSLMRKMNAETIVIERPDNFDIDELNEVNEEKEGLEACCGKDLKNFEAIRFTFLTQEISKIEQVKDLEPKSFLGNAVLINTELPNAKWHSYIFKAIMRLPTKIGIDQLEARPLMNNYIHVWRDFDCKVSVGGKHFCEYKIQGTFFCQQNTFTSVCAHCALKMLINNMRGLPDKFITTKSINDDLAIRDFTGLSETGFDSNQVAEIIKKQGLLADKYDFFADPNTDYAEYLSPYIESGCTSLLILTTRSQQPAIPVTHHVVPVIGHTLNSDLWRSEAELAYRWSGKLSYVPASRFYDNFIIHDDNFGMYLCLPVDSLKRITLPKYDPDFRSRSVITITPTKILMPGNLAEKMAIAILREYLKAFRLSDLDLPPWVRRLCEEHLAPLVVRTTLIKNQDYKYHLGFRPDFEGNKFTRNEIATMTKGLPDYFWLIEVTLPDLFTANRSKLVDIVYACDKPLVLNEEKMAKGCLLIRFPGMAVRFHPRKPRTSFALTVRSHYPRFKFREDLIPLEW